MSTIAGVCIFICVDADYAWVLSFALITAAIFSRAQDAEMLSHHLYFHSKYPYAVFQSTAGLVTIILRLYIVFKVIPITSIKIASYDNNSFKVEHVLEFALDATIALYLRIPLVAFRGHELVSVFIHFLVYYFNFHVLIQPIQPIASFCNSCYVRCS